MSTIPNCQHIKTNGLRCGSPALLGHNHCYLHSQQYDLRRRKRNAKPPACELPPLEDANAIQIAVMEVARALLEDRLDLRRAGLLLYALQIASSNLKRVNFEPITLQIQATRSAADPAQGSRKPPARDPSPLEVARTIARNFVETKLGTDREAHSAPHATTAEGIDPWLRSG